MSMGTRGSTTGTVMMLTICFDLIVMNITEAMMRTTNSTMAVMLKFNVSGFQSESNDPAVKMIHTHTDHLVTRRKKINTITHAHYNYLYGFRSNMYYAFLSLYIVGTLHSSNTRNLNFTWLTDGGP